jgi:hypothetical protein
VGPDQAPGEMVPFFLHPLSSAQAWFAASAGLVLAVTGIYEHARRKETPLAVGCGLAALGLFMWAGFRGPVFLVLVIAGVAVLVPWLIWGRKPRAIRSALLARSPIVIHRRTPLPAMPAGVRGIMDFRRDGERAMKDANFFLTKMGNEMVRYQKRMPKHQRRLERATQGASTERQYRLIDRAARDIEAHASEMDGLEGRLRVARESMIANFTDWLRSQSGTSGGDEIRAMLRGLGRAAGEGRKGAVSYQKVVDDLRRQSISIGVNRATERLGGVLARVVEDIRSIERFCLTEGRGPAARRKRR